MADHPAVQKAVAKALSEALGTIQRQLGEVQGSFEQVKDALSEAGEGNSPDRFVALLPPLMHMQASGAALAACIETVLRFVGISAQWSGVPAMAPPVAERVYRRDAEVAAEPAEIEAAVEEPPVEEPAPPPVEEAAPVEEPVAEAAPVEVPPAPAAPAPLDIGSLPDDLRELHKKAKRFAKVTVQDLAMYKKNEIAKGLENRDLYKRLKDEIDRSKATYDKRFDKIAEHNVDYLYEEIVRVLTKDDPGALGDYPYPIPSRQ